MNPYNQQICKINDICLNGSIDAFLNPLTLNLIGDVYILQNGINNLDGCLFIDNKRYTYTFNTHIRDLIYINHAKDVF